MQEVSPNILDLACSLLPASLCPRVPSSVLFTGSSLPGLQMLDPLLPLGDEIVLPKTSSSVFQSTNLHYLLRNLGVAQLVVCGCVTDQCVEHAVRDACDLGYLVTLVPGGHPGAACFGLSSCEVWRRVAPPNTEFKAM